MIKMASRSIFIPKKNNILGVIKKPIDFKWFPGMSITQKQKSIRSLHEAGKGNGINNLLEISSKSENELGQALSAFNLAITTKTRGIKFSVECAFQSSKVFVGGGPYKDILSLSSKKAKKDFRLRNSGSLKYFKFFGEEFSLKPRTHFYDWIYINALNQNMHFAEQLLDFDAYTDIEFNPEKSINCQAYSAALFVSLYKNERLKDVLQSSQSFLEILKNEYLKADKNRNIQDNLL